MMSQLTFSTLSNIAFAANNTASTASNSSYVLSNFVFPTLSNTAYTASTTAENALSNASVAHAVAVTASNKAFNSFWVTQSASLYSLSNVGIGKTNPAYTLDVGGDINFTGTLRYNGSVFARGNIGTIDATDTSNIKNTSNLHALSNSVFIEATWAAVMRNIGASASINGSKVDNNGNIYIIGTYNTGGTNYFYNANMASSNQSLPSTQCASTGFVAKVLPTGSLVWITRIEGSTTSSSITPQYVDVDVSNGFVYLCGNANNTLVNFYHANGTLYGTVTNTAANNGFIVKYSMINGEVSWFANMTGAAFRSMAVNVAGSMLCICGDYYNFAARIYNANNQTSAQGSLPMVSRDINFVLVYNSMGAYQWYSRLEIVSVGAARGYGIAIDLTNNIYLTGLYTGTCAIYNAGSSTQVTPPMRVTDSYATYVIKFNSVGLFQWHASVDSMYGEWGQDVVTDTNGNVFVSCIYQSDWYIEPVIYNSSNVASSLPNPKLYGGVGPSALLIKFNPSGVAQWFGTFDGETNQEGIPSRCYCDSQNNVWLTGICKIESQSANLVYNNNTLASPPITLPSTYGSWAHYAIKWSSDGFAKIGLIIASNGGNVSPWGGTLDSIGNIYLVGQYQSNIVVYNPNNGAPTISTTLLSPTTSTNAGYIVKYNVSYPTYNLQANLAPTNNGFEKQIVNTSPDPLQLNITSSNNAFVLNTYNLPAYDSGHFVWFYPRWYKL